MYILGATYMYMLYDNNSELTQQEGSGKKTANLVWQAKSMTIIILFEKKLSA